MTQAWPPKGWYIKKVVFTKDTGERPAGEYWQGIRMQGGSTSYYKNYADCKEAVEWYDKGFKYGEL